MFVRSSWAMLGGDSADAHVSCEGQFCHPVAMPAKHYHRPAYRALLFLPVQVPNRHDLNTDPVVAISPSATCPIIHYPRSNHLRLLQSSDRSL
eukprot:7138695-Alexandrium_andersonii.AAC.1